MNLNRRERNPNKSEKLKKPENFGEERTNCRRDAIRTFTLWRERQKQRYSVCLCVRVCFFIIWNREEEEEIKQRLRRRSSVSEKNRAFLFCLLLSSLPLDSILTENLKRERSEREQRTMEWETRQRILCLFFTYTRLTTSRVTVSFFDTTSWSLVFLVCWPGKGLEYTKFVKAVFVF